MEAYWGAAAEASKLAAHDAGRSPPASQPAKKAKAVGGAAATKVRKSPSWPRSWANFSSF